MAFKAVKLLVADAILLSIAYLLLADLDWRVSYAASPHASTSGYATSFSYGILTYVFNMSNNIATLQSPVTLDWLQLVVVVLVGLNLWFAYPTLKKRFRATTPPLV